jgi:hypothetical protein
MDQTIRMYNRPRHRQLRSLQNSFEHLEQIRDDRLKDQYFRKSAE